MTPHIQDERTPEQVAAAEEWAVGEYGKVRVRFTEGVKGRTKRRYMVSIDGKPEVERPSVTTIIDKHFAKNLDYYHEQKTTEGCAAVFSDVLSEIGGTTPEEVAQSTQKAIATLTNLCDPQKLGGALYAMGLTPRQIRDEAGLDGDVLHKSNQDWFDHGQIPDLGQVAPDKRGKMQALAGFLSDVRPRPIAVEPPIYSSLYGFAGRPDLLAETDDYIPALIQVSNKKDDVREGWLPPGICLFDYKSGNKLWTNHGIQMGMYEQALSECNFPPIDWRIGVHLRDGKYVLHAFPDSRSAIPPLMSLYDTFKSLNRQKPQLNKSFLIEPEVEAAIPA